MDSGEGIASVSWSRQDRFTTQPILGPRMAKEQYTESGWTSDGEPKRSKADVDSNRRKQLRAQNTTEWH